MAILQCDCGRRLKTRDELAGKSVRCPACAAVLKVPAPLVEATEENEEGYALAEDPLPAKDRARAAGPVASLPPSPPTESRSPTLARANPSRERQGVATLPHAEGTSSVREYLYLLLILAPIPLVISVLAPDKREIQDRISAALDGAGAETLARVKALETREDAGLDDLLEVLPEGKLDATAHLPRSTWVHWVYAGSRRWPSG